MTTSPGSDKEFKKYMDNQIQQIAKSVELIKENSTETKTKIEVLSNKVDDFSYRLRKLEDSDTNLQKLMQKLELIVQKLEPSLEKLEKRIEDDEEEFEKETDSIKQNGIELETRIAKIENNWKWVCFIATFVSGIIGYLINITITHLVHLHGG